MVKQRKARANSTKASHLEPTLARGANEHFGRALIRAFAGAIIFSLPLLLTMELWWLGFTVDNFRLVVFTLLSIHMLALLSYFAGFQEAEGVLNDIVDAFVAYAVGFITCVLVLLLVGVLTAEMSAEEIIGKVAIQTIPGSIGALLARDQLSEEPTPQQNLRRRWARYPGQLFVMGVGALFLALNLAPTEEMVLAAYKMTIWQTVLLAVGTILVMHGFTTSRQSRKQEDVSIRAPGWLIFLRFTLVGYALALLVGLYLLWVFGRLDGVDFDQALRVVIVLGFPAGIGAGAAQLII